MEQGLISPGVPSNFCYYWTGLAILALNCLRHRVKGYRTPRTFAATEVERAARYDVSVVRSWLSYYRDYLGADADLRGKRVLEIGPGEDLGAGLTLLAEGASRYHALDAHYLLDNTPVGFYEVMFRLLKEEYPGLDEDGLRRQLGLFRSGAPERLDYRHQADFDPRIFGNDCVDIVFSQAAFEHIADPRGTIAALSDLVVSGGVAVVLIDFMTHSRWIRDRDPLNIYRYPDPIYSLFTFSGIPNRLRPNQYREAFEDAGWENVRVYEKVILADDYLEKTIPHLAGRFRKPESQMHIITGVLCATRKPKS
jgi:SAM-dependent methyltransferase